MPRRSRITATIVIAVLGLLALAPALPAVRDAVLGRILSELEARGVSISYRASSGNAWSGVVLHDAHAVGLGSDLSLERLRIGYFIPSLLGGELPVDIIASGAKGDLDLEQLLDQSAGGAPGGGIRLRLRQIDLREIGVSVKQVPFTLPDMSLEALSVEQQGTALLLAGTAVTADGRLEARGRFDTLTGALTAEVLHADAAIARNWWDGVDAGVVRGQLRVRGSSIEGEFALSGGAVSDLGFEASDVSGTVTLRYPVISAELTGSGMNGTVTATGVVNVTSRRWEAGGTVRAGLSEAADWLARNTLDDGIPVPVDGTVVVDLRLAGWRDVAGSGTVRGAGTVAGLALADLATSFRLIEGGGISVEAAAQLGGGAVALNIVPDPQGDRLALRLTGADTAQAGLPGSLDLNLDLRLGEEDGRLLAAWSGELVGRAITADLDARLDPDGWQAFLSGADDAGGSYEGAMVLTGNVLQGEVHGFSLGLPGLTGAERVSLRATGALDDLALTLTLAGSEPVTLAAGPLSLASDLRGSANATFSGGRLSGITGNFGPLALAGGAELAPVGLDLTFDLAPTLAAGGGAAGEIGLTGGRFELVDGSLSVTAGATLAALSFGPAQVEVPEMALSLVAPAGEAWSLSAVAAGSGGGAGDGAGGGAGANLTAGPDGFELALVDLPARLLSADGTTSAAAFVSGTLSPRGDDFWADLSLAPGATAGPVTLASPLNLSGPLSFATSQLQLAGALGSLPFGLGVGWSADGVLVSARLDSGAPEAMTFSYDSATGAWDASGAAELAPLAEHLGLPLAPLNGALAGAMRGTTDQTEGAFDLTVSGPVALSGRLTGAGRTIAVVVSGDVAGLAVVASGELVPAALLAGESAGSFLLADVGPLTGIQLDLDGARGEGTLAALVAGPATVPPVPWRLTADWRSGTALLALPGGELDVRLTGAGASGASGAADLGGATLGGGAALPIEVGDLAFTAELGVGPAGQGGSDGGQRVPLGDLDELIVHLRLLDVASGALLASASGPPSDLSVTGDLPLATLFAAFAAGGGADDPSSFGGSLALQGHIDLTAGPSYQAELEFNASVPSLASQDGASQLVPYHLAGNVTGSGADFAARLAGEGLELSYQSGADASLRATAASLTPLLPAGLAASVDGALSYGAAGWSGELTAALTQGDGDLTATARLRGDNAELSLQLDATGPLDARLAASGSVTPRLDLSGTIEAFGGAESGGLSGELNYRADAAADTAAGSEAAAGMAFNLSGALSGVVRSQPLDLGGYASLPAQTANVAWRPGESVTLQGEGIRASLTGSELVGRLDLAASLLDRPVRLRADLSGSLAEPRLAGEVAGEGLAGTVAGGLDGVEAELTLAQAAIDHTAFKLLPEAASAMTQSVVQGPLAARLSWRPGEPWSATAHTDLLLPSIAAAPGGAEPGADASPTTSLELALTGEGLAYGGKLSLLSGGQTTASVDVTGVGAGLAAALDLGTVNWHTLGAAFGLDLELSGSGALAFTSEPLHLELSADLAGSLNGMAVALAGSAVDELRVSVEGGEIRLAGRLALSDERRFSLSGTALGQPIAAELALAEDFGSGSLTVTGPDSRLVAELTTLAPATAGGAPLRQVTLNASSSGDAWYGVRGEVSATLHNLDGVTSLEALTGEVRRLPGLGESLPLHLRASGELAPTLTITGLVEARSIGEAAPFDINRAAGFNGPAADAAPVVQLHWQELALSYAFASGLFGLDGVGEVHVATGPRPAAVFPAQGELLAADLRPNGLAELLAERLPAVMGGASLQIASASLRWSPASGFSGEVDARLHAPSLPPSVAPGGVRLWAAGLDAAVAQGAAAPAGAQPGSLLLQASAGEAASAGAVTGTGGASSATSGGNVGSSVSAQLWLAPNPVTDQSLAGQLDFDLSLATLLLALDEAAEAQAGNPVIAQQPPPGLLNEVRIAGSPRLNGSLSAPAVSGALRLAGPVSAAGEIVYAADGGTLHLSGDYLEVSATSSLQGWLADVIVTGLPVDDWLPQLSQPRLSFTARGSAAPELAATVEALVLESGRSRVTGGASLGRNVRVALQAQVDLSDLNLGDTELRGLLRGPLVLTAGSLAGLEAANITAMLDAAAVSVVGFNGSVSGSLHLGGRLNDPLINAQLRGDGEVRGGLRIDAAPMRQRLEISSTVALGDFQSDLSLATAAGQATASGMLRYGEAVLLLGGDDDGISLTGAGWLEGWNAQVRADLGAARLAGPLAAISSLLGGEAELTFGAAGEPGQARGLSDAWLLGGLSGVSLAGQVLGDLDLASASLGAPIRLSGDGISASIDPNGLAWQLTLDELALAGGLLASAQASGTGAVAAANGRLSGNLGGALAGGPSGGPAAGNPSTAGAVSLDFSLRSEQAAGGALLVSLTAGGELFGGGLELVANRAASGAWSGGLDVAGAEFGGFAISAAGDLIGNEALPQLVLTTHAENAAAGLVVSGRATAGGSGITLDQVVSGSVLTGALGLQGRLSPTTDLTLFTLASSEAPSAAAGAQSAANATSSVRLQGGADLMRAAGLLVVPLGPATVYLEGAPDNFQPALSVQLRALPGTSFDSRLPGSDLLAAVNQIAENGLGFTGSGGASGLVTVRLAPELSLELDGLAAELAGFALSASGRLGATGAALEGELVLPADLPVSAGVGRPVLPWRVSGAAGVWQLLSDGPLGTISADYAVDLQELLLEIELTVPTSTPTAAARRSGQNGTALASGTVSGRASYSPATGPNGTLTLSQLRLAPGAIGNIEINADATIAGGRIEGAASVDTNGGRLSLAGDWGLASLLPVELAGGNQRGGNLEMRARTLELAALLGLGGFAPHLSGDLTGFVQLRDSLVIGQLLIPEFTVADHTESVEIEISGTTSGVDAVTQFAGSLISAGLRDGRFVGSARLERFPANLLAEAVVGPTDLRADVTGVLRFDLPAADPASGYLRLATEQLSLERAGVITTGELTLTYDDRRIEVSRAVFSGRGRWQAEGTISPELLDFSLEAVNADFTPLLGLFPDLARFGVGADGSFSFTADGSVASPSIRFTSRTFDLALAGNSYRLANADIRLEGANLSSDVELLGLEPRVGEVKLSGDARLVLDPLALRNVDFRLSGAIDVPGVGLVSDVNAVITQNLQFLPEISLTGTMGSPVSVQGTLVPLDLRGGGTGISASFPALLVADATVNADLWFRSVPGGLALGGAVLADEIVIDPAARNEPAAAAAPAARPAPGPGAPIADSGAADVTADPGAQNALAALHFESLTITAPQRVSFSSGFGSLEAALDLTLSGTAADPRLSGSASALRGSLRFAGREFAIDRAVATFTPNSGVFPALDVAAHAEFDKLRALQGNTNVEFAAPSGTSFVVFLAFSGQMLPAPAEEGGFRFDVVPVLASDALIELNSEGLGAGTRSLTESELYTLLTLGRLELSSDIIGAGGLGGAVAQGALDTAIDLLVVSELQNALREALGIDVVEIRTSAFSTLLDGSSQPFGVSVRFGGYINPELFASYRIGTRDDVTSEFAVTNEVTLSYALGPVAIDLTGRLDFPLAGVLESPRPEIGIGLRYDFARSLSVDTGVVLSTDRSLIRFGVSLRW